MAKTVAAKSKQPTRRTKSAAAKAKTETSKTKPRAAKPGPPTAKPKRLAANTNTAEARAKAAAAMTKAAAKSKAASKQGRTERKPSAGGPQARQADTRPAADDGSRGARAKIRVYRHGLGDCFLITLPRKKSASPYRILIDCGVILGTADAITKMTNVVEDIVHEFRRQDRSSSRHASALGPSVRLHPSRGFVCQTDGRRRLARLDGGPEG